MKTDPASFDVTPMNIEVVSTTNPHDVEYFTYSDGSTAVVSTSGASSINHSNPTASVAVGDTTEVYELTDLLIEQKATREPTTFAREQDGYNKNAVDSYIHHIHTLLTRYGKLLKSKKPGVALGDDELNAGIPKFRSTRVDVLLEELVYTNRLVNFFREEVNKERTKNRELQEQNAQLQATLESLQHSIKEATQESKKSAVQTLTFKNLR